MNGYIYLTTCLVNNKKYIGQSINYRDVNTYLGSGIAFKCALKKYGKSVFTKKILIDNVNCLSELNKLERELIIQHDCLLPKGYNLDLGGTNKGRMSELTKSKIIKSKTGKKHTHKQIQSNIKSHIGLKLSDETKKKIGDANRGRISWRKGKKMSQCFIETMRRIKTGVKIKKKKIEIVDKFTSVVFICDGVVDAAIKIGVSNGMVSLLLNKKISHIKNRYYLGGVTTHEAQSIG